MDSRICLSCQNHVVRGETVYGAGYHYCWYFPWARKTLPDANDKWWGNKLFCDGYERGEGVMEGRSDHG